MPPLDRTLRRNLETAIKAARRVAERGAAKALDSLAVDLPDIPTDAGFPLTGAKSIAERKEELRIRNMEIAKRLVDVTGWSHARVQAELNRLSGITSVGSATNDQLEKRARHGETWLTRR